MARKTQSRKPSKAQKKQIVAFKVEDDLADFLDALPNKSEFIRKAILAQFGMTCPLCSSSTAARSIARSATPPRPLATTAAGT